MKKTLIILRHGKSDWDAPYGGDADRPLAPRGVRAARGAGSFLAERKIEADRIVASPALRARDTAGFVAEAAGWTSSIEIDARLYEHSLGDLGEVISETSKHCRCLVLVGHLPWVAALTSTMVGGGAFHFSTAAMSAMTLRTATWSRAEPASCDLRWFIPAAIHTP